MFITGNFYENTFYGVKLSFVETLVHPYEEFMIISILYHVYVQILTPLYKIDALEFLDDIWPLNMGFSKIILAKLLLALEWH